MTHAAAAAEALRDAVQGSLQGIAATVEQARQAQARFREADDLLDLLRAAATLAVTCEAVKDAAKRAEEATRDALAEAMSLGATTVTTDAHVVSLVNGAPTAHCSEPDLVPPDLWSTPKPRPNTVEAAKRLRKGLPAPGFVLRNSKPHVAIKAREQ